MSCEGTLGGGAGAAGGNHSLKSLWFSLVLGCPPCSVPLLPKRIPVLVSPQNSPPFVPLLPRRWGEGVACGVLQPTGGRAGEAQAVPEGVANGRVSGAAGATLQ